MSGKTSDKIPNRPTTDKANDNKLDNNNISSKVGADDRPITGAAAAVIPTMNESGIDIPNKAMNEHSMTNIKSSLSGPLSQSIQTITGQIKTSEEIPDQTDSQASTADELEEIEMDDTVNETSDTMTTRSCMLCDEIDHRKFMVKCNKCKKWSHFTCSEMPAYHLTILSRSKRHFTCEICIKSTLGEYVEEIEEYLKREKEKKNKYQIIYQNKENRRLEKENKDLYDEYQRLDTINQRLQEEVLTKDTQMNDLAKELQKCGEKISQIEVDNKNLKDGLQKKTKEVVDKQKEHRLSLNKCLVLETEQKRQLKEISQLKTWLDIEQTRKINSKDPTEVPCKSAESPGRNPEDATNQPHLNKYEMLPPPTTSLCIMHSIGGCEAGDACPNKHTKTNQNALEVPQKQMTRSGRYNKEPDKEKLHPKTMTFKDNKQEQDKGWREKEKKQIEITIPDTRTQHKEMYTIKVPDNTTGLIIGRGGTQIRDIQLRSNAIITSPPPGSNTFTILGNQEEIRKATDEMKRILIEAKAPDPQKTMKK